MKNWDQKLVKATLAGDIEGVKTALHKGADANARADNGWFSLACAARGGHVDIVRLLLDAGADIHARPNQNSWYALDHAALQGHADVVVILLAAGANPHADNDYPIQWTARHGHVDVVRILIAAGVNVHAGGHFALRRAAFHGHVDVVRVLLAAGADPVAAWLASSERAQPQMAATLCACVDAMTPKQCKLLAAQSKKLVSLRTPARSARQHQRLQR